VKPSAVFFIAVDLLRSLGSASVVRLIFSRIWHVGCDVHQSNDGGVRSGFGNHGSPIAMSDKNARSILLSKDALRGSPVFLEGCFRLLDDTDVVAVLDENVVNAFSSQSHLPRRREPKQYSERDARRSVLTIRNRSTTIMRRRGTEIFLVRFA